MFWCETFKYDLNFSIFTEILHFFCVEVVIDSNVVVMLGYSGCTTF